MPVNDKLPILEPTQDNRKNGVATFVMIVAILVWSLGGVLTAFAGLAYAEIGTFQELFIEMFPEGMMLTDIILLGIRVFIGGMLLLALSEVIRLLQRSATTTYTLRYLDLVIPQTISVSQPESYERSDRERDRDRTSGGWDQQADQGSSVPVFRTSQDQSPVSITVNVHAASAEAFKAQGAYPRPAAKEIEASAAPAARETEAPAGPAAEEE